MAEYIDTDLLSGKVIRKQCKTEDYWINDVKAYRGAKAYSEIEHAVDNFLRGYHEAVQDVLDIIAENTCTDSVPVVHGKWVEYPRAHYFKCSNCKYTVPHRKANLFNGKREYNYYPHCGAKMDS